MGRGGWWISCRSARRELRIASFFLKTGNISRQETKMVQLVYGMLPLERVSIAHSKGVQKK